MIGRRFLLTWAFLAWSGFAARAGDPSPIDQFIGGWVGHEVTSTPAPLAPDALDLSILADADGFQISWRDLGFSGESGSAGDQIDAQFVPTDRPGVYEYAPKRGSLLARMFASPASGNPLEGETLLWARIEGSTLAVYSMRIDPNGAFDLGHYQWTRSEKGLRLAFSERTDDTGAEVRIEGQLVSEGG